VAAGGTTLDANDFDDLSRVLGGSITRKGIFKLLAVLSASGLTVFTGVDLSAAQKRNRDKKRRRRNRDSANTCPLDKKNAVCHCPEGLGGAQCKVNCVGTGGGHTNDTFDCMCAGSIKGVPDCDPTSGRCPEDFDKNVPCGGPTTCGGTCTKNGDCPFNSVPGCTCNLATGQCELPPVTCPGPCATQETCTVKGAGCICRTLDGICGDCLTDGEPAGGADECCSGQYCALQDVCGPCTPPQECAGGCDEQSFCTEQEPGCVCRTLDGICGVCLADGETAGGVAECCSGDYCDREQICGRCAPLSCGGSCAIDGECAVRGGGICRCVGGTCQTAVGPIAACPPDYTGNATSPCDSTCPCLGGRRCRNGRCCERKGTHCKRGKECCSGRCKKIHSNHKQCS
jgi:hypothetical protein